MFQHVLDGSPVMKQYTQRRSTRSEPPASPSTAMPAPSASRLHRPTSCGTTGLRDQAHDGHATPADTTSIKPIVGMPLGRLCDALRLSRLRHFGRTCPCAFMDRSGRRSRLLPPDPVPTDLEAIAVLGIVDTNPVSLIVAAVLHRASHLHRLVDDRQTLNCYQRVRGVLIGPGTSRLGVERAGTRRRTRADGRHVVAERRKRRPRSARTAQARPFAS